MQKCPRCGQPVKGNAGSLKLHLARWCKAPEPKVVSLTVVEIRQGRRFDVP